MGDTGGKSGGADVTNTYGSSSGAGTGENYNTPINGASSFYGYSSPGSYSMDPNGNLIFTNEAGTPTIVPQDAFGPALGPYSHASSEQDPWVNGLMSLNNSVVGGGIVGGNGAGAGTGAGAGGLSTNNYLALIGQAISAYGAYKSTAANAGAAAAGPVLPRDVVAPRQALSDIFLRQLLTPGGLDYGAAPFDISIGEGTDPFAAVNKYRESSQPLFQQELGQSLDSERAKLGGQYGIRFGTDLQRGLGDTVSQATAGREATLGQLGVSSYDSFMNRRLAELGTKLTDYRQQKFGLLPLIANYLGGQPTSSPFQGGSPSGQALQGIGGGLSNLPLYQYLNSKTK